MSAPVLAATTQQQTPSQPDRVSMGEALHEAVLLFHPPTHKSTGALVAAPPPTQPTTLTHLLTSPPPFISMTPTYFQVPDIYDSAKYDTLHNAHLKLSPTLQQLDSELTQ